MNLFLSYAYTDRNPEEATREATLIVETLKSLGHTVYCDRFDPVLATAQQTGDVKTIFDHLLPKIPAMDRLIVIVSSPQRSVGQLIEVGAALAQHVVVDLYESASAAGTSYLPQLASSHHVWQDYEDLSDQLSRDFSGNI